MKARKLVNRVRLRIGDTQGTRFSDYELLAAVNNAIKMLWIALAEHYSTIPRNRVTLKIKDGSAALPADYYSLVELTGKDARIEGFKVYCEEEDTVDLTYNYTPKPVESETSSITLPYSLTLDAVEIAATIAGGNIESAASLADTTATRIAQKREYARLPDWRHFT